MDVTAAYLARNARRTLRALPLLLAAACADLDVTAPPQLPTGLLGSPQGVALVADSAVNSWWLATTHYEPSMMLQVTSDALTSSFCWGMRFNNVEPRIPLDNYEFTCGSIVRPWRSHHKALRQANDAIAALDAGIRFAGDPVATERARAAALFAQAASQMQLAFLFDSSFALTAPPTRVGQFELKGYRTVRDTALAIWDRLIALTDGKAWQLDAGTLPLADGPPTAERLNRVARTMAARTLVLSARTAAENVQTDWARVLAYADGGITGGGRAPMDFGIVSDDVEWYDYIKRYGSWHSWLRVDQRLIHRMAPNIPVTFTGLAAQPLPEPVDARLAIAQLPCVIPATRLTCTDSMTADYAYVGNVIGDPGRGVYMMSPFIHRRWEHRSFARTGAERLGGTDIHVLAAENDLMIAEALVRTNGDRVRAAGLVNRTRVTRGSLPPVGTGIPELLAAIEYERDVELVNTGAIALFDRRRVDGLQPGTFRHLPVPDVELRALGKPVYTYGGVGLPDM